MVHNEDLAGNGHSKTNTVSILETFTTPFQCGAACQIGVSMWSNGNYDAAIEAYKLSLKLDPQPPTYFNLAVCYDDMGDENSAVEALINFYEIVSAPLEIELVENMLKQNGKVRLIKKARERAQSPAAVQLGSRTSVWVEPFIGKRINKTKTKEWYDFSKEEEVIFGYPSIPGVYAKIIPTLTTHMGSTGKVCSESKIFIFVATENKIVTNVSYSVIYIDPMGKGDDLLMELKEDDAMKVIALLEQLTEIR